MFSCFLAQKVTEASSSKHRQWMGIAFNAGYPVGTAVLAGLAYFARDWKQLQLIVSLPALILLFHAWYRKIPDFSNIFHDFPIFAELPNEAG